MPGRNDVVSWQAAQLFVLMICVAVFGVALNVEPVMWQMPQLRGVPLKIAFRWHDSHGRSRWTPSGSKLGVRWKKASVIGGAPATAICSVGTSISGAVASSPAI